MQLIHNSGDKKGRPLAIGDKVPGGRLEKYYAVVERIEEGCVIICYNGEVKSVRVGPRDYERILGATLK